MELTAAVDLLSPRDDASAEAVYPKPYGREDGRRMRQNKHNGNPADENCQRRENRSPFRPPVELFRDPGAEAKAEDEADTN